MLTLVYMFWGADCQSHMQMHYKIDKEIDSTPWTVLLMMTTAKFPYALWIHRISNIEWLHVFCRLSSSFHFRTNETNTSSSSHRDGLAWPRRETSGTKT